MPQFAASIKHIKEGMKGFTVSAAVKNIEGWEETLGKLEVTGAKTMVRDLVRLKKLIRAEEIDGEAVKTLVARPGKEIVTMAGRSEGAKADRIKEPGEALNSAAA